MNSSSQAMIRGLSAGIGVLILSLFVILVKLVP